MTTPPRLDVDESRFPSVSTRYVGFLWLPVPRGSNLYYVSKARDLHDPLLAQSFELLDLDLRNSVRESLIGGYATGYYMSQGPSLADAWASAVNALPDIRGMINFILLKSSVSASFAASLADAERAAQSVSPRCHIALVGTHLFPVVDLTKGQTPSQDQIQVPEPTKYVDVDTPGRTWYEP